MGCSPQSVSQQLMLVVLWCISSMALVVIERKGQRHTQETHYLQMIHTVLQLDGHEVWCPVAIIIDSIG